MKMFEINKVVVTQEDIDDIMCTALEGGICDWCCKAEVVGEYLDEYAHKQISRGGSLKLYDYANDNIYLLDLKIFQKGLELCFKNKSIPISNNKIDTCMIDILIADEIIQYAIFGKLTYS